MAPLWEPDGNAGMTAHLADRITSLEQLAMTVEELSGASLADRASLHQQADALASQLAAAVIQLGQQVSAEVAARASAVSAEASTRAAADAALSSAVTAAQSAITTLQSTTASTSTALATAQAAIVSLQQQVAALAATQIRTAIVALPLLAVGNTDQACTWQSAMPSSTYTVVCALEGGTSILGKLSAVMKSGTRTATGCTVTLTNTGLVAIAAGAYLHVVAYTA